MTGAETLVWLTQVWAGIGVLVAAAFLTAGLGQIDEDARDAVTFRPMLVPGILVLWPLVLWRWWVLASGRDRWPLRHRPPRQSHRFVAVMLALLILLTLMTTYMIRQSGSADVAPVQLEKGAES